MKKMTNKQVETFNKIAKDYSEIEPAEDLIKRNISYSDYTNLGYIIDELRYTGETQVLQESIANYFANLGCKSEYKGVLYFISL